MKYILFSPAMMFTAASLAAAELPMCDLGALVPDKIEKNHASVKPALLNGHPALEIHTESFEAGWPGVNLYASSGKYWDLSAYTTVAVDVRNIDTTQIAVEAQLDNDGGDGDNFCVKSGITLQPGETSTMQVFFPHRDGGDPTISLVGMRNFPEGFPGPRNLDAGKIRRFKIFVSGPQRPYRFQIANVRAIHAFRPVDPALRSAKSFFPFIDGFGQYKYKTWPGKTVNREQLTARVGVEARELAARPAPKSWNRYGGYAAGPQLRATGFFRVEKYQGKWFLVDPEGRLFFSNGITCVTADNGASGAGLDSRWHYFSYIPTENAEYKDCFSQHSSPVFGFYRDRKIKPRTFDFFRANLYRKYGRDLSGYGDLANRRLRSWGMNTLGNWSSPEMIFQAETRLPYVATVYFKGPRLEGHQGYWEKFWDVYSPELPGEIRRYFRERLAKSIDDPYCIGFFIDNEITWGDRTALARAALISPAHQATKIAVVEMLKKQYADIATLNAAWGVAYASWEALLAARTVPTAPAAQAVLEAINQRIIDKYFEVCRDNLKAVAPNALYLGCRFNGVNPQADAAAARYCDVVSYNLYAFHIANFRNVSKADVPILVGEFHFGAWESGMFSTGIRSVATQADRGRAYLRYLQGALKHPQIVGAHWFCYADQPTVGRSFDGESYSIGFVDICDTPYQEMVRAAREIGETMYEYRLRDSW